MTDIGAVALGDDKFFLDYRSEGELYVLLRESNLSTRIRDHKVYFTLAGDEIEVSFDD
jgi:hypothetical protein